MSGAIEPARKRQELAEIGEALLHGELTGIYYKLGQRHVSPEEYCRRLADSLDSPFEDVQPNPVLIVLIQDWIDSSDP